MAGFRCTTSRLQAAARFCALSLCLGLPACTTLQEMVAGPLGSDMRPYAVQDEELTCAELQARVQALSRRLQALSQRTLEQMPWVPNSPAAAWARFSGSVHKTVPAVGEYNEVRARLSAASAVLARKTCRPGATASVNR